MVAMMMNLYGIYGCSTLSGGFGVAVGVAFVVTVDAIALVEREADGYGQKKPYVMQSIRLFGVEFGRFVIIKRLLRRLKTTYSSIDIIGFRFNVCEFRPLEQLAAGEGIADVDVTPA